MNLEPGWYPVTIAGNRMVLELCEKGWKVGWNISFTNGGGGFELYYADRDANIIEDIGERIDSVRYLGKVYKEKSRRGSKPIPIIRIDDEVNILNSPGFCGKSKCLDG